MHKPKPHLPNEHRRWNPNRRPIRILNKLPHIDLSAAHLPKSIRKNAPPPFLYLKPHNLLTTTQDPPL